MARFLQRTTPMIAKKERNKERNMMKRITIHIARAISSSNQRDWQKLSGSIYGNISEVLTFDRMDLLMLYHSKSY